MSTPTTHPPEETRTLDAIVQELAACASEPSYDHIMDDYPVLFAELCDAVAPAQDETTTTDFCERCQPVYLQVDEQRNEELCARERMAFRLGVEVGRRASGGAA